MRPVLFELFGLPVQSYGVSKLLAALVAAWLLSRAFATRGLPRDDAYALTFSATAWGFVGAKAYYLVEHVDDLTWHDFGGMGFTWYGGFLAGGVALLVTIRRHRLPLIVVFGLATAPASVAYGIGRLGCLLAGDGTYGKPSDLPWAMSFPDGAVPTSVAVQPTPLYEAMAAFALAGALWWMKQRWPALVIVSAYLIGSGVVRVLVEMLRTNRAAFLGLTQPQLWSIASIAAGVAVLAASRRLLSSPVLIDAPPNV